MVDASLCVCLWTSRNWTDGNKWDLPASAANIAALTKHSKFRYLSEFIENQTEVSRISLGAALLSVHNNKPTPVVDSDFCFATKVNMQFLIVQEVIAWECFGCASSPAYECRLIFSGNSQIFLARCSGSWTQLYVVSASLLFLEMLTIWIQSRYFFSLSLPWYIW